MKTFILFITFSFLGWIAEVLFAFYQQHKLFNRGYLIGPLCPIYGFGALFSYLLFKPTSNPIIVFITAFLLAALLEYSSSFIVEKIFNIRLWDYSKIKFNVNGRICIPYLCLFSCMGIVMVYILNPGFNYLYQYLNNITINIIFYSTLILFIIDNILSIYINKELANKYHIDKNDDINKVINNKFKIIIDMFKKSQN